MDNEHDLKGVARPRFGWALTGSGHFFKESLEIMRTLPNLDVFVSKAAAEVIRMYKQDFDLASDVRIFKDTTASSAPVGAFYATNVFAQAGKTRVPTIVFACDTAPVMDTEAPKGMVKVYPRRIDLECTERLKTFDDTTVVETVEDLQAAVDARLKALNISKITSTS